MGSVLSFPFLCIASLSAYIYSRIDIRDKLVLCEPEEALKLLQSIDGCGINGDDSVFSATGFDQFALWEEGVAALGGVVSRGKTLTNHHFATVNSVLLRREGNKLVPVPVPRPSLLCAVNGQDKVPTPARWGEYIECQLFTQEAREKLNLEGIYATSIPTCWGGSGLRLREWDMLTVKTVVELTNARLAARGVRLSPWKGSEKGLEYRTWREKQLGAKRFVVMDASYAKAYGRIHNSPYALWRDPVLEKGKRKVKPRHVTLHDLEVTRQEYQSLWEAKRSGKHVVLCSERLAPVFYAQDITTAKLYVPECFHPVEFKSSLRICDSSLFKKEDYLSLGKGVRLDWKWEETERVVKEQSLPEARKGLGFTGSEKAEAQPIWKEWGADPKSIGDQLAERLGEAENLSPDWL